MDQRIRGGREMEFRIRVPVWKGGTGVRTADVMRDPEVG